MSPLKIDIKVPEKLLPLYTARDRFIVIFGGRGSAKSWGVADFLLVKGMEEKRRFLCTREIQSSIRDSVHKLLSEKIKEHKLENFYRITEKNIVGINGTEFIFKGLFRDDGAVKSMEGVDIAWCEESQNISRSSLELLTPTIRKPGSQIIFTYNPTNDDDPVHVDYTLAKRDDCLKIEINYTDNPWFPDVLRNEMEYDLRVDPDKHAHKWLGQCVRHSEAQIFYGKWAVQEHEAPEGAILYYGIDWGFAVDPVALVRCYITDNTLYIDYEAGGVGIDIDKTPDLFDSVPGAKAGRAIADSARPETISYMNRHGYNIKATKKGKGSVEDGISFLRSFEKIIVHPRCKNVIDEFRLYCYKADKRTGIISNVPEDKNNHYMDATRYALEDVMRQQIVKPTMSLLR